MTSSVSRRGISTDDMTTMVVVEVVEVEVVEAVPLPDSNQEV